jgi:hypothetical protein
MFKTNEEAYERFRKWGDEVLFHIGIERNRIEKLRLLIL